MLISVILYNVFSVITILARKSYEKHEQFVFQFQNSRKIVENSSENHKIFNFFAFCVLNCRNWLN